MERISTSIPALQQVLLEGIGCAAGQVPLPGPRPKNGVPIASVAAP
jgi:hypothetical protein